MKHIVSWCKLQAFGHQYSAKGTSLDRANFHGTAAIPRSFFNSPEKVLGLGDDLEDESLKIALLREEASSQRQEELQDERKRKG